MSDALWTALLWVACIVSWTLDGLAGLLRWSIREWEQALIVVAIILMCVVSHLILGCHRPNLDDPMRVNPIPQVCHQRVQDAGTLRWSFKCGEASPSGYCAETGQWLARDDTCEVKFCPQDVPPISTSLAAEAWAHCSCARLGEPYENGTACFERMYEWKRENP